MSLNHRWLGVLCTAMLLPLHALHAQTACSESPAPASSAGRPLLGQGVALYDARDHVQAERALQAALFSGLTDSAERASAHKYLAYIYCSRKEVARCETAFEAAFTAHAGFSLQSYETTGTPWSEAYSRAQTRWTQRCPNAQRPHSGSGFALNSRVITEVSALASASAAPARASTSARTTTTPTSDHNLRLRISPWAQVRINGKAVGVTPPLVLLKLQPGSHTVELLNPGFESYRQVIQLTEGKLVTLSHDFDAR